MKFDIEIAVTMLGTGLQEQQLNQYACISPKSTLFMHQGTYKREH